MNEDTTSQFFQWMDENGLKRGEVSALLGVDEKSLSNYKSRGLPKKKMPLALRIMAEHTKPPAAAENKINLAFTDAELDTIEAAAIIVATPTREYMRRAVIARARQDHGSKSKTTPTTGRKIIDPAQDAIDETNGNGGEANTSPA